MHNVKIDFTHPATVIKSKEKDKNKTPAGVKVLKDKWVKKWLVMLNFTQSNLQRIVKVVDRFSHLSLA